MGVSVAASPCPPDASGIAVLVLSTAFGSPALEHTCCLFMWSSIPKKFCLDCSARNILGIPFSGI